jgi:hypothetical protein
MLMAISFERIYKLYSVVSYKVYSRTFNELHNGACIYANKILSTVLFIRLNRIYSTDDATGDKQIYSRRKMGRYLWLYFLRLRKILGRHFSYCVRLLVVLASKVK